MALPVTTEDARAEKKKIQPDYDENDESTWHPPELRHPPELMELARRSMTGEQMEPVPAYNILKQTRNSHIRYQVRMLCFALMVVITFYIAVAFILIDFHQFILFLEKDNQGEAEDESYFHYSAWSMFGGVYNVESILEAAKNVPETLRQRKAGESETSTAALLRYAENQHLAFLTSVAVLQELMYKDPFGFQVLAAFFLLGQCLTFYTNRGMCRQLCRMNFWTYFIWTGFNVVTFGMVNLWFGIYYGGKEGYCKSPDEIEAADRARNDRRGVIGGVHNKFAYITSDKNPIVHSLGKYSSDLPDAAATTLFDGAKILEDDMRVALKSAAEAAKQSFIARKRVEFMAKRTLKKMK